MIKRTEEGKKKKAQYDINYAKNHYKRIPLDVTHDLHSRIVDASQTAGESVNGFIKTAVIQRLDDMGK